MEIILAIFDYYKQIFNQIPDSARLLIAFGVFIVIGIILIRFIKRSIVWLLIALLLMPALAPAAVTIYQAIFQKLIEPILK